MNVHPSSHTLEPPVCCDNPMTLVAKSYAACFDLSLWRCLRCEHHEHKSVRIDGKSFWVGAMGRAIARECLRMTAEAWGSRFDEVNR